MRHRLSVIRVEAEDLEMHDPKTDSEHEEKDREDETKEESIGQKRKRKSIPDKIETVKAARSKPPSSRSKSTKKFTSKVRNIYAQWSLSTMAHILWVKDTISDSESEGGETKAEPKPSSSPSTKRQATTTKRKKAAKSHDEDDGDAPNSTSRSTDCTSSTLVAPMSEPKNADAVRDVAIPSNDIVLTCQYLCRVSQNC